MECVALACTVVQCTTIIRQTCGHAPYCLNCIYKTRNVTSFRRALPLDCHTFTPRWTPRRSAHMQLGPFQFYSTHANKRTFARCSRMFAMYFQHLPTAYERIASRLIGLPTGLGLGLAAERHSHCKTYAAVHANGFAEETVSCATLNQNVLRRIADRFVSRLHGYRFVLALRASVLGNAKLGSDSSAVCFSLSLTPENLKLYAAIKLHVKRSEYYNARFFLDE